jgi:RNA polymerase nonessential primary-like sigma factor
VLDHEPTAEEIAEVTGEPVASIRRMLKLNERISSVDTPIGGDGDKALLDMIADETATGPENQLQNDNIHNSIVDWLDVLNGKQKEVLARRFGLLGHEAATLEEVGLEIGLTRERVRQIQVEALKRLKEVLKHEGLNIESLFGIE